jgi:hypothetical protein
MARRRRSSSAPRGKSEREARIERLTWGALVLVFALFQFIPETAAVPNWLIPLSGAVILLGSGMVQYSRGYQVSPVTWIGGVLLAVFAFYNLRMNPATNFLGASLLVFAAVILFGVISGET